MNIEIKINMDKYMKMIPNYADYENEPKIWTKVTGYNQIAVFQKMSKENYIQILLGNYHIPYKSE